MNFITRCFVVTVLVAIGPVLAAEADGIDMNDPHRALAREGDIRIDAQLMRTQIVPGSSVVVTYQIQNQSQSPIAIAAKHAEATYDPDTQTITLAIGAEVPSGGRMPQMTTIDPGKTKVLRAAAVPSLPAAVRRARRAFPRYVQVKVTVMRELTPFRQLIDSQSERRAEVRLPDELFDRWFEANDTILLNTIPVQWSPASEMTEVERRGF